MGKKISVHIGSSVSNRVIGSTTFENTDINFPEKNALHLAYQDEIQKFIGIQLAPRIASLNARLKTSSRPYRINNSLGVLFAIYRRVLNF